MTKQTSNVQAPECQSCGWVFKSTAPNQDEQTAFISLSDDWQCPLCGAAKASFVNVQNSANQTAFDGAKDEVVIIGAGLAGWAAVDAIRAISQTWPITLICADRGDRYHKPMLSASLSQNKSAKDLIRAKGEEAAKAAGVKLINQTWVTRIDAKAKCVHIQDTQVPYGALVLAFGATPWVPDGIDKDLVWDVNHLDRYQHMQEALSQKAQTVAIIGAGMVGTEMAEDMAKAGHQVSLFDVAATPLATLLPQRAGQRVLDALKQLDISFVQASISALKPIQVEDKDKKALTYSNEQGEQKQDFDQVLLCTGLQVDTTLAQTAGIKVDAKAGIGVDEATMATSMDGIYAIGDCASINGLPCRYVAPLRPQAAAIAAQVTQAEAAPYVHKNPMIRLKNKAITIVLTGTPCAESAWETKTEDPHTLILQQADTGAGISIKTPS